MGEIFNWILAALPVRVQIGCLVLLLLGIAALLLWAHHG
jgi:hypothetical protein